MIGLARFKLRFHHWAVAALLGFVVTLTEIWPED